MGNQFVIGQHLIASAQENHERTFTDDPGSWWIEESLKTDYERRQNYVDAPEPEYDMISCDSFIRGFSRERFDELTLGSQVHVYDTAEIKSMRKEDKTGEDQDYADGVIVDIDETQFEKQFVIILGNGTLIWASKNELKLGCSELNSPKYVSYRCSILENILNCLKKQKKEVKEGKKAVNEKKRSKTNRNENPLFFGPYSKKVSDLLLKCFYSLTKFEIGGKKKNKHLQHSFSPKLQKNNKHHFFHFPPPLVVDENSISPRAGCGYVSPSSTHRTTTATSPIEGITPTQTGQTTDNLPWHNCFESRSQRNAKKPARKLRHSSPRTQPQNHNCQDIESPTYQNMSSSFFDLHCSTTITFYDDNKNQTDDDSDSLILPPSFISPRVSAEKNFDNFENQI